MASEQDDPVFDRDIDDDDMSSQSLDIDDDDEEDLNAVTIAIPSSSSLTVTNPNGSDLTPVLPSEKLTDAKRQSAVIEAKKPQLDESRRGLFQRLWTDEDEIELLQGFLDYTAQRGTNHHDTALFYDQIKSKLQLDFNKNQLVEKLRRLKKKYRNVLNKISSGKDFSFKSPHDQATFEISRRIWSVTGKIGVEDGNLDDEDAGNVNVSVNLNDGAEVKTEDFRSTPKSRKRSRSRVSNVKVEESKRGLGDGFLAAAGDVVNNSVGVVHNGLNVSGLIEETVRSCVSPLFKELLGSAVSGGSYSGRGMGGLAMNAMPLSFGGGEMMADERWRKQQILELEVYSKRLELVQEQIRAQLEELRSVGGG